MAIVKRGDGRNGAAPMPYQSEEDEFATSFPTVSAFLMDVTYESGEKRKPGTVMLVNDAGTCKAWVHDVDAKEAAWVSSQTLWGLFQRIEQGLLGGGLEWRVDRKK